MNNPPGMENLLHLTIMLSDIELNEEDLHGELACSCIRNFEKSLQPYDTNITFATSTTSILCSKFCV